MTDLVLLLPLLHISGLLSTLPVGLAGDAECCSTKTVGGLQYNLVDEFDTTSYNCLSNCVYVKKDKPGQRFCFKRGSLAVSCMAADMTEKMEAVKEMKEKWEEVEREAMDMGKEQSINAQNMTNLESLTVLIKELDGHMEEMKGFMAMNTYIQGVDVEAAMSTQEPKMSSPNQGTTSASSGMTEEELEDYVVKTKLEMSSLENNMGNSNYTGSCCKWRSAKGRNFTFFREEDGAVTSGCSSSCVYKLPEDMTRKFCDLGGDCLDSAISSKTPDFLPPQFAWVDSTTVLVTYQNTMDVLHLSPMESSLKEACLYDGALEVETTAFATLQGCYNTSADARWEILLVSSHLPLMQNNFIWWANGTVSEPMMMPSNCDTPDDCVEDVFTPPEERQAGPRLASNAPIPTYVELDFELMYDNSLVRRYGIQEAFWITYVTAWQGCAMLRARSIIPRVICKFNYPTHYSREGDGTNLINDRNHHTVGSRPRHIVTDNNNKDRTLGRVRRIGLSCPTARDDIAVTEHWGSGRDIAQTARTFAHEMGHWLGMRHDFDASNGGDNGPCNNQGLMSYGSSRPYDWSVCSNINWQADYRSTQHRCRADVSSRYSEGRGDYVAIIEPTPNTNWGPWGEIDWCNRDTFVHAAIATIEWKQGWGDDTALNRLYLACGTLSRQWLQGISSSYGPWGDFRFPWDTCRNGHFMRYFRLRSERPQGGRDDTSVNGFDAWCQGSSHAGSHNDGYWGDWLRSADCPGNSVICGLQTRVEPQQGAGDDTALNAVRFSCCLPPRGGWS